MVDVESSLGASVPILMLKMLEVGEMINPVVTQDSRGDTSGIGNAAPAQPNDEVVSQPSKLRRGGKA